MKKLLLSLMMAVIAVSAGAQDTVRYGDPWYAFNPVNRLERPPYQPCPGIFKGCQIQSIYRPYVQAYRNNDYIVYGIAYTADTFPGEWLNGGLTLLRGLEFHSVPETCSTNLEPYWFIDSNYIQIDNMGVEDTLFTWLSLRRKCVFEYPFGIDTGTQTQVGKDSVFPANCFEFYFDTPISLKQTNAEQSKFSGVIDTFYIGGVYCTENLEISDQVFVMGGSSYCGIDPTNSQPWLYLNRRDYGDGHYGSYFANHYSYPSNVGNYFHAVGGYFWGIIFPIVKLRCVTPEVSLEGRGEQTASLSWRQHDLTAPEGYEVAIGAPGSDPDTAAVVQLNQLEYTITGLAQDSSCWVWVRKSCRYTTAGYDTVVWSDWSEPLVVEAYSDTAGSGGAAIGDVEDGGLRIYSQQGAIVVEGVALQSTVQVYDMLGRQVAVLPPSDSPRRVLTPPAAGVYVVKAGDRYPRRVVVLR